MSSTRTRVAVLAALTLLGGVLRLIGLDAELWIDEISSMMESFRPPVLHLLTVFPGDTQHPLYSLLANLALKTLGEANWVIRLPAALFGTATVPLLYLFGRRITTEREAFLAAGLLAVSYHHVWFSQNARGYTLLLFFTVLASLFLLEGLRSRRSGWLVGYAVAAALGAYTHLTMILVVAGQAVVALLVLVARWRRREASGRDLLQILLAFGGAAALTVLLYAPILGQLIEYFTRTRVVIHAAPSFVWFVDESVRILSRGFGNAVGVVMAVTVVAIGTVSHWRTDRMALGLLAAPGVVTLLGALAARGYVVPRYFFPLASFALLLGVRGVMASVQLAFAVASRQPDRRRLSEQAATAVLMLAIAASAIPTVRSLGAPKQDFGGAARWIEQHVPPEDRVATVGVTNGIYEKWLPHDWTRLRRGADLGELRRDGRRLWIVYTFPRLVGVVAPDVMRVIREECGPAQRFRGSVGDGDVLVCPIAPLSGPGS